MVGKAQRTKNNVKASNSGRSAQLLANLPNTSFIGFSTLKDTALHTTPDLFDDSIGPDFQIILKKMNKKDSVTKHKALHEFAELCNNSDIETLKPVVPLWPRLYSILSIDIENRVREATQFAHKCMVTRVKKIIAPHLKHLIGPWIVSQFDTYPPAASVAKTSFEDVFPPLKRTEVFAFCKDDLFNYIVDNLIVQTPQTMSNPKMTDAINMEMKYERVISSTLQAYALFISKLPPDILQSNVAEHTDNILSTAKFWKLQKHESGLIRASWYHLMATLIEKCPQVFASDLKKLAVAIFSNLNETDVKVNANVWDAALYCVLRYDAALWACLSIEKLVIPHVCSTLENGFHGNASQIAAKLLPLLSKLPEDANRLNIYEKVLTSLLSHIVTATSVKLNSSERESMIKCYTECCRYVLKTEPAASELLGKIVLEFLLPLYKITSAHAQFSMTLRYLYQIELDAKLIDSLWEKLTEELTMSEESLEQELCLHASLVQCLWNPNSVRKTEGARVKFQEDTTESGNAQKSQLNAHNDLDSPCPQFTGHIHSLISHLMQYYLTALNNARNSRVYILHICNLSVHLDVKFIYDLLPLPESFNAWGLEAGDGIYELMVKYITQLHTKREESLSIFRDVSSGQTMPLFTWCLSHYNNYRQIVRPWLEDISLQDTILSIVDNVTRGSSTHTELLRKCFGENEVEEIRIHPKIAEQVYRLFVTLFIQFGANRNEFQIDYENCARLLEILIRIKENPESNKTGVTSNENANLLKGLMKAIIMKKEETDAMLSCWQTAVNCIQPDAPCKKRLYILLHEFCVNILIEMHSSRVEMPGDSGEPGEIGAPGRNLPNVETSSENEEPTRDLFARSIRLASTLMGSGFDWGVPSRPYSFICSALKMWHMHTCAHGLDVCTCEAGSDSQRINEWNIHESEHVHSVYWHVHVYMRLALELMMKTQSESQSRIEEGLSGKTEGGVVSISSEGLSSRIEEGLIGISSDYCVYSLFMDIYEKYLPPRSRVIEDAFTHLYQSCSEESKGKVWTPSSYGFLSYYDWMVGYVERRQEVDTDLVISGANDLIKLSLNISALESQVTSNSFINYVRDHSKDTLVNREDVTRVTSMVQVVTKLLSMKNDPEKEEGDYVENIVNSVRGEIMLCVTSQLVAHFTHITCNADEIISIANERILLASQLLECYQQIDKYCVKDTSTEFSVEWNSVFADDCKDIICHIWVFTATMDRPKTIADLILLDILCSTLYNSSSTFSTLNTVCPLLLATSREVQITAYDVMSKYDVIESYDVIASTLTSAQTVVDSMLTNFSLGDTCMVLPGTDSYTYSLGYLLTWSLIVRRCNMAEDKDSDISDVALWLKDNGYISALMRILLELMPESIVHCTENTQNVQTLFQSSSSPQLTDVWTSTKLSQLACRVYYQVLARFPALVRSWWNDASPSESALVEKLTSKYVSPLLCAEELRRAAKFTQENMQIRVFPGTKEVVATYTLEEASMEITISLPSNHPLGVIKVDSSKNLFPNTQWIKQITKFLIHANGSICDGLASWKSNMDKKFDGVEECYICFCILHSRNHELPRKSCRTCQKKFHSYCLFKWFTTSNKSTCPICRNLF